MSLDQNCRICGRRVVYYARDSSMALQCSGCGKLVCCDCGAKASLSRGRALGNMAAGFEDMPSPCCTDGSLSRADAPPDENDEIETAVKAFALIGALALGITGLLKSEDWGISRWVGGIGGAVIGLLAGGGLGFLKTARYAFGAALALGFVGGCATAIASNKHTLTGALVGAAIGILLGIIGSLVEKPSPSSAKSLSQ